MNPDGVKLGHMYQCRVTGLRGVAVQRLEQLNGNVRFSLQPRIADEDPNAKMPDAYDIDAVTLEEFLPANPDARVIVEYVPADPGSMGIPLNVKVEDLVTGFTGITTCRAIYLNGCVLYMVEPEHKEGAKQAEEVRWFNGVRLRVLPPPSDVFASTPLPQTRTGGPPSRSMR